MSPRENARDCRQGPDSVRAIGDTEPTVAVPLPSAPPPAPPAAIRGTEGGRSRVAYGTRGGESRARDCPAIIAARRVKVRQDEFAWLASDLDPTRIDRLPRIGDIVLAFGRPVLFSVDLTSRQDLRCLGTTAGKQKPFNARLGRITRRLWKYQN
jgi:hypothetical protein